MEELYDLYARFEEDFLAMEIATTDVPWIRQHFERTFRPLNFPKFCAMWSRTKGRGRRYLQKKWEMGCDRWFARQARRTLRQMRDYVPSPEVQQYIRETMERLRSAFGEGETASPQS